MNLLTPRFSCHALATALALLFALGCSSEDGGAGGDRGSMLRIRDGWFVDTSGRTALLHGVNVVYKLPPYLPSEEELGEADADLMRDLGFNVVRLGFIWHGLQPERGALDRDYLARYTRLVERFTSRGLYVLVDAHQDLWHESFGGEGAPDWAVFQPPRPPSTLHWGLSYFIHPEIGNAFADFWNDRDGIQSEYLALWRELAGRFAANPRVLGYDLMNEPWTTASWLVPQDSRTLEPFYRRAIPTIREVDPEHTVFYATGLPGTLGVESDLGVLGEPNLALSFHVYCATSIFLGVYLDDYCAQTTAPSFDKHRATAAQQGSGWLLTEFGASDFVADIERHADVADQNLVGWTHWAWKRYRDPTGEPDEGIVESDTGPLALKPKTAVLERAYARAIAGVPTAMHFDVASAAFELRYVLDAAIVGPTEIWLPLARHYPAGYDVTVAGGTASPSPRDARLLLVEATPGSTEVHLTIARR